MKVQPIDPKWLVGRLPSGRRWCWDKTEGELVELVIRGDVDAYDECVEQGIDVVNFERGVNVFEVSDE